MDCLPTNYHSEATVNIQATPFYPKHKNQNPMRANNYSSNTLNCKKYPYL